MFRAMARETILAELPGRLLPNLKDLAAPDGSTGKLSFAILIQLFASGAAVESLALSDKPVSPAHADW
jgi:hypothetical protein